MVRFKIAVVPALLAVALFGSGVGYAGDGGKNGEGGGGGGGYGDGGGAGGGDGGGKNGGGGGNGGNGDGDGGGNGGGGGGGKGGEHPGPSPGPGPGPSPNPGPKPGGGNTVNKWNIVCVINGEVFRVRHIRDCASQQVEYRPVVRRKARRVVRQVVQQGCDCNYGGGQDVIIGGGSFVGSPAAVRQARRRANAYGYYEGGYSAGGGYGYGEAQVVVRKKRGKRKRKMVYYDPNYGYDSGVVFHSGPAVVKGGGY